MKKIVLVASLGLVGLAVQASEPVGSSKAKEKLAQEAVAKLNEAPVAVEANSTVSNGDTTSQDDFLVEVFSDDSSEGDSPTVLNQSVATTGVKVPEAVVVAELPLEDDNDDLDENILECTKKLVDLVEEFKGDDLEGALVNISQNVSTNNGDASLNVLDDESESASEENIVDIPGDFEEPKVDDSDKGVSFRDRFVNKQTIYTVVGAACLVAFYLYNAPSNSEKIVKV